MIPFRSNSPDRLPDRCLRPPVTSATVGVGMYAATICRGN
jgi:hypothetical protein